MGLLLFFDIGNVATIDYALMTNFELENPC